MLAASAMLGNSGDGGGATATEARDSGGGGGEVLGVAGTSSGGFSEEDKLRMEESDRNSGGNRWPRQETLALLQIRSDMDVAFRDSSLKGPLWDEVSRKLAELGYHRSAKKCKEKFENVYKYHRRTKEGRSTKPDGKTYRFFDQLEALENQAPPSLLPPPPPPPPPQQQQPLPPPPPRPQSQPVTSATPVAVAMPATTTTPHPTHVHPPVVTHVFTVPSMANLNPTINPPPSNINPLPTSLPPPVVASPISFSYQTAISPPSGMKFPVDIGSISTSSSTSSDDEPERRGRRKRKWGDFFQRLMSEVIEKQEDMQKKFLETLDRRERERVAREEAWRAQEMARMNREHELLVHERSVAAAKDAAVIQFLQKISDQQIVPNAPQMQMQMQENTPAPQPPQPQPPRPPVVVHPPPQPQPQQVLQPTLTPPQTQQLQVQTPVKGMEIAKTDNGGGGGVGVGEGFSTPTSSSRWPKTEVEALIRLRTNMDTKYQENVPKGPLWEEISAAMRRIGYDRNAKRCKEKWENINKYFKKVKESNKKRPEDSKTCPYFQQLDELYKEKAKNENNTNNSSGFNASSGIGNVFGVKPENIPAGPIMVQPEQQYRPEDDGSQDIDEDEGDDEDEDEDDEAGGYEVVPNKASNPVGTTV